MLPTPSYGFVNPLAGLQNPLTGVGSQQPSLLSSLTRNPLPQQGLPQQQTGPGQDALLAGQIFSGLGQTGKTVGLLDKLFGSGSNDLGSSAASGLGGIAGLGLLGLNASEGRGGQAALSGIGGLGGASKFGSTLFADNSSLGGLLGVEANPTLGSALGAAGAGLGALGGLGGAGLSFSQGRIAEGIPSLISGAGGIAGLTGVGSGGAAAGGAGLGTAGAVGGTLAGGLGAIGGVAALGVLTHYLAKLLGEVGPPEGFKNWTEYRSSEVGKAMGNKIGHALQTTPQTFGDTMRLLSGTLAPHGEVQFGFGRDLQSGDKSPGGNGMEDRSAGYDAFLQKLSDPATLQNEPEFVKNAITSAWVQKGRGGVVPFDPDLTRVARGRMLAGLPIDAYWNQFRQQVLNSQVVDTHHNPEHVAGALAEVPQYPVENDAIYVGRFRLPVSHRYQTTAGEQMPAELVGLALVNQPNTRVFDMTSRQWVGADNPNYYRPGLPVTADMQRAIKAITDDTLFRALHHGPVESGGGY